MNAKKLEIGMRFKNYYKLCEALEIKPITNRQKQLKSISRYIAVDKIQGTQGYIVTDIYEKPIPKKVCGRKKKYIPKITEAPMYTFKNHGNSKYAEFEKKILLKEIAKSDEGYIICDRRELIYMLGMYNAAYVDSQYKVSNKEDYSGGLNNIEFNLSSVLGAMVQGMLNSLNKINNLIVIEDVVVCCRLGEIKYKIATETEYKIFNQIIEDRLKAYSIRDYRELYHPVNNKKQESFHCIRDIKQLVEKNLGWTNYIRKMKISLNPNISTEELKAISEYDIQEAKTKLNDLIIKRIRDYMQRNGQKLFNYNPETVDPIVIGNEEYGVRRKAYEEYCADLELIIDKYIRI